MTIGDYLYRQVDKDGGDPIYVDPSRKPMVSYVIFLPARGDSDGLSLIDASKRSREWACHRPGIDGKRFSVFELPSQLLANLGQDAGFEDFCFEITPDGLDETQGEPFAHCVAPRINRPEYESSKPIKKKIKEWAMSLAHAFDDREYILRPPYEGDLSSVPYRPSHILPP